MVETIARIAVRGWMKMRLIDADALLPMMKYATTDSEIGVFPIKIGFNAIAKVIDDAPTVDAVEVVRCKDCKYYEEQDETIGTCLLTESGAYIEGYCSWAGVREE